MVDGSKVVDSSAVDVKKEPSAEIAGGSFF